MHFRTVASMTVEQVEAAEHLLTNLALVGALVDDAVVDERADVLAQALQGYISAVLDSYLPGPQGQA